MKLNRVPAIVSLVVDRARVSTVMLRLVPTLTLAFFLALGAAASIAAAPEMGAVAQETGSAGEFSINLPIVSSSAIVGDERARAGRRLTFSPANAWQPALSPDGQNLVYVAAVTEAPDGVPRSELHFITLDSDPPTDIAIPLDPSFADVDLPTFTSDGGAIIFAGRVADPSLGSGSAPVSGSGPGPRPDLGPVPGWDVWRLDLSALTPADPAATPPSFEEAISPGPHLRNLTDSPEVDEHRPGLSPDGTLLVYDALIDGNEDLWLLDLEKGTRTRLTNHPSQDVLGSFSPDGRRIVFRSASTGRSQILSIVVDGTRLARLTLYESDDSYPSFTGDGRIVFQSNRGGTDGVYRIAANGRDPQPLLSGSARYLTPRIAPDGSTIVFSSDVADPKAGVLDIYMLSLDPVAPSEGP